MTRISTNINNKTSAIETEGPEMATIVNTQNLPNKLLRKGYNETMDVYKLDDALVAKYPPRAMVAKHPPAKTMAPKYPLS